MDCHLCGAPVPVFGNVLWCDACIEEYLASGKAMDEFIAEKRAARAARDAGGGR